MPVRRKWVRVWSISDAAYVVPVILLTSLFLLGGAAGCLMSSWVGGGGSDGLAEYIRSYLLTAQEGTGSAPSVPALLWDVFRYPAAVWALGFTALGLVGIPAVFAVRGFFLSFAISSFVRMFGGYGLMLAAVVFGIPSAFSIPVLFVLGSQGWVASRSLAERLSGGRRRTSPYDRPYWGRCGMCAAGLLLCVWVEQFVTVRLLAAMAGSL